MKATCNIGMACNMFLKERSCPNCEYGKILTSELPKQARCLHCHKLIEVSLMPLVIVGGGFTFLVFLFLYLEHLVAAGIVFALFSVYNVFLHQITGSYFPLKCYDDD